MLVGAFCGDVDAAAGMVPGLGLHRQTVDAIFLVYFRNIMEIERLKDEKGAARTPERIWAVV